MVTRSALREVGSSSRVSALAPDICLCSVYWPGWMDPDFGFS